jgi:hypothetical protein
MLFYSKLFLQILCRVTILGDEKEHFTRHLIYYGIVKPGNLSEVGHASLSCMHVPCRIMTIPFMHKGKGGGANCYQLLLCIKIVLTSVEMSGSSSF